MPAPRRPVPAPAPAGSPWAIGRDTDRALAALGLGPTAPAGAGECAMWDGRIGQRCHGAAAARAVFSRTAYLPVCKADARAIETRAQERGSVVHLAPLR